MKKLILTITMLFMAPLFILQSKSKAAEMALTAENFPDAQVLKEVKKADKDGNGILTQQEIEGVTELSVGKKDKTINIKNISLLSNLRKCSVVGKRVDNLDEIYGLSKCEELEIDDYSAVDSMDFSRMQTLKKMMISNSAIRKLIISNAN